MTTTITYCEVTCPHCGRRHDVHEGEGTPKENDLSICWGCKMPAIYTADGSLRVPTEEEWNEIGERGDIGAAMRIATEETGPREAAARLARIS